MAAAIASLPRESKTYTNGHVRNDRWFHSQIFAIPLKKQKFEKGPMGAIRDTWY
jgi:hypothetical protein